MKQADQKKRTILYGRLSQEDAHKSEGANDSNSIINQRQLLEKYAKDNGFANVMFLYDDGYTGTNFERPAWKEIMEMIDRDEVATLIVKDMSRLGREYLQVGLLTEMVFPQKGVRFIAVNDSVDSQYSESNDFTPMRNYFNEFYAKDCSRKGRAVVKMKAESGARVAARPPYGYQKDPADPKRHIIPDEETAPVVRHIFQLCIGGKGPNQIAKQLKEERVLNPTNYYFQKYGVALTSLDTTRPYDWGNTSIATILEDEVYLGHTINLKTTTLSYKNKKVIDRPLSEQVRTENTHEAIIGQDTFDIVQDIRKHKKRPTKMDELNIFSGLVYCADCGGTMVLHRAHTMKKTQNNFMCSTYKKRGKDECTAHYINANDLEAVVLDDLRRTTHFARQNEKLFAERINQKNSKEIRQEINVVQKELTTIRRRDGELTKLFKRMYEDQVLGRLPAEQFRLLSDEYLQEQSEIKQRVPQLESRLEKLKASVSNVSQFIEKAKQFTEISELTSELLHIFIERIEIGERAEKFSRTAPQEIRIHYRDIGLLDTLPENDSIAKESAEVVAMMMPQMKSEPAQALKKERVASECYPLPIGNIIRL